MGKLLCVSARHVRGAIFAAAVVFFGTGTTQAQTIIDNVQDLEAINNNLSGNYVLGASFDASGFNFTPITNTFNGSLNGDGYTISNLSISSTSPSIFGIGLFSNIGTTGSVSNLTLSSEAVNLAVSSPPAGPPAPPAFLAAGGLAGTNYGTVTNISVTGSVSSSAPAGTTTWAGGLVGDNVGSISNSSSTASVTGGIAGGLVGTLNGGSISQSYSTGSVNAPVANGGGVTGAVNAGGLVGLQFSGTTISQSYATGAVTAGANGYAGGLVGFSDGGNITQSYASGAVSGPAFAGGLVGPGYRGASSLASVSQSYWDTQTSGQATSGGGTPQTTAFLKSGLPSGFDPTVWAGNSVRNPNINNGYPNLLDNHPLPPNYASILSIFGGSPVTVEVSSPQQINSGLSGVTVLINPSLQANQIWAYFTPNGATLQQAAQLAEFKTFDWVQTITYLPSPSPYVDNKSNPLVPPYTDPPPNGYTQQERTLPNGKVMPLNLSAPFYYNPNTQAYDPSTGAGDQWSVSNFIMGNTLSLFDEPDNSWLSNGCQGLTAPKGCEILFSTRLVGVNLDGSLGPTLFQFDWASNSTCSDCGAVDLVNSLYPFDPGNNAVGGVTLLSATDPLASTPLSPSWVFMLLGLGFVGLAVHRRDQMKTAVT